MEQEYGLHGGREGLGLETSFVYGVVVGEGTGIGVYCRSKQVMLMTRNFFACWIQVEE